MHFAPCVHLFLTSKATPLQQVTPSSSLALQSLPSTLAGQNVFGQASLVTKVQQAGEMVFAGLLSIAFLQAFVALIQYRTNPCGQLINPPGLTYGVAKPKKKEEAELLAAGTRTTSSPPQRYTIETKNASLSSRNFTSGKDIWNETEQDVSTSNSATVATTPSSTTLSEGNSQYAKIMNTINKWLVVLVPLVGRQWAFILQRNTHLFHLGFILLIGRMFDLPHQWFDIFDRRFGRNEIIQPSFFSERMDWIQPQYGDQSIGKFDHLLVKKPPIERIIVLGDSLAVGLGSVNVFDSNKNNSLAFKRIENLGPKQHHEKDDNTSTHSLNDEASGPVFPRVLAETLATEEGREVSWRSAGVDGGDTEIIHKYCLGVVKEEVDAGRPPDVITLLLGINDFKYFMSSNPLWGHSPGPRGFRIRLKELIMEIHDLAPGCTVVLPSVPTQMFHRNSPLNIFPLNFFVDTLIGFWDSLKSQLAVEINREYTISTDRTPAGRVLYLPTSTNEIKQWYADGADDGLIAADGVHPNARCYAKWAASCGRKLLEIHTIVNSVRPAEIEPASGNRGRQEEEEPADSVTDLNMLQIRFDGSLRPPRDPGFSPVDRSLAACSATILAMGLKYCGADGQNEIEESPMCVGTKILPLDSTTTSQHTEYEGILLALEWLCEYRNRKILVETLPCDRRNRAIAADEQHRLTIVIEGDCKTVIDQLSGRSAPRKLQDLHRRASSRIETIKKGYETDGWCVDFIYRHIQRSQNALCDQLCTNLTDAVVTQAYRECLNDLKAKERFAIAEEHSSLRRGGSVSLGHILQHHLDPYDSIIPYSKRLQLYHRIASIATKEQDFEILDQVGRRLCDESKYLIPNSSGRQKMNSAFQHGVSYRLEAVKGMGKGSEYAKMKHKYRALLERKFFETTTERSPEHKNIQPIMQRDDVPLQWSQLVDMWAKDVSKIYSSPIEGIEDRLEIWTVHRSANLEYTQF